MKILAIIPARGGSKGVPRKNIKPLGGKPLMAYTIESALASKNLAACMVSTDDTEIASAAAQYGLPVPFMRPAELALDNTPTLPVLLQVLEEYEKQGHSFDAVMILQPTCPFRQPDEIDECINIFINRQSDSLISVKEVPDHYNPHWVFEEGADNLLKIATGEDTIIPRRQELPKAYVRDGSVYITKTEVLKQQQSLFGKSIAYRINTNPRHVNIDTMQDWEQAESLL